MSIKQYKVKHNNKLILAIFSALLFSLICFYFFVSLDGYISNSVDRNNYLRKFSTGDVSSEYVYFDSYLKYFTSEWLWNAGVFSVTNFFGNVNGVLLFVSFSIIFFFSFFILLKTRAIYLLFLINPLFVDLAFSQLRIGFAFIFLGLAYYFRTNKFLLSLFILMSLSIHTSTIIFIVGFYLIYKFDSFIFFDKNRERVLSALLVAFFASVLMGPLRELVLTLINDRRAIYSDISSSYAYMSYWFFLLAFFVLSGFRNYYDNISLFAIFVLSIACFNTIFGAYNSRFVALALPFIAYAISVSNISSRIKIFVFLSYISFTSLLWLYWV